MLRPASLSMSRTFEPGSTAYLCSMSPPRRMKAALEEHTRAPFESAPSPNNSVDATISIRYTQVWHLYIGASMIVVTTKADYGMRAAIELARRYEPGEPVQVKEIAERQHVPKDYLSLIMVDLRKA